MKFFFHLALGISLCLFSQLSVATDSNTKISTQGNPAIAHSIDQLLKDFGENTNIGIIVEDLQTKKILYSKNATRYYTPASNLKLFTAYAALNYLKPSFTFHTQVLANLAQVHQGNYQGDIYFKFDGDPQLSFAQLDNLVFTLKKLGINTIQGNIVLDNSAYDTVGLGPGWMWDDQDYCYGAPLDSFTVDQNCFHIKISPATKVSALSQLQVLTQPLFASINNHVTTVSADAEKCSIKVTADNNNYQLQGCIKVDSPPETLDLAYHNYALFSQKLFSYLLLKNGISLTQQIIYGKAPNGISVIAEQESKPLQQLVTDMLKNSDNLIADSLFKKIGAVYAKDIGTWENGKQAVQALLQQRFGLQAKDLTMLDGAGGSRYNLVTPAQVLKLLTSVYNDFNLSYDFIAALPIAGIDGTLHERMTELETQGKIRAKTGSMTGISSLSGYLMTDKQHILAFAILINGFNGPIKNYRDLEDKICQFLISSS